MKARVLIVEDDEDLTILFRYNLESEGYAVQTVSRGDAASDVMAAGAPDILVLDWGLPGLSGVELCRKIRLRNETSAVPIIMVTGRTDRCHEQRALASGVNIFFRKPFSLPLLIDAVRNLLDAGKRRGPLA